MKKTTKVLKRGQFSKISSSRQRLNANQVRLDAPLESRKILILKLDFRKREKVSRQKQKIN